jgi:hypothetical protein
MTSALQSQVDRLRLADALSRRLDALLDAWQDLGDAGPSHSAAEAGPPDVARARYFHPLGRAFVGALGGSADHAALYFDERLR